MQVLSFLSGGSCRNDNGFLFPCSLAVLAVAMFLRNNEAFAAHFVSTLDTPVSTAVVRFVHFNSDEKSHSSGVYYGPR